MKLQERLALLISAIGTDVKNILATRGNMATLTTSEKTNLVGAINELKSAIQGAGANINDNSASTAAVYSSQKTTDLIAALKSELLGGAPAAAFDTLKEIADYLASDETAMSGLVTAVGHKVDYSQAQSLTTEQKTQARTNIAAYGVDEIGDPDTDLLTAYNTAKA